MKFVTDIKKEKYEKFVKNHKKSHFLQSYAWGEFSKKARGLIPHYVGLTDNKGNLKCATLLLEKKLPFNYSYFYAPRGYIIDFEDKKLLKEFTEKIIEYTKQFKSIFIKIDPDIIWNKYNYKDEKIDLDNNAKDIFNTLTNLGYKHLGFTKNFETMQPRYTFRIDMNQTMDDIISKFNKTNKQRINKGKELNALIKIGNSSDILEFNKLMELTENRKDFISHDYNYYKNLYDIYTKDNEIALFMGSIKCSNVIKKYEDEKDEICKKIPKLNTNSASSKRKKEEYEKRIDKLNQYIEEYKEAKEKYGDEITLASQFIIIYGNKSWALYAGNHNVLLDSCVNYATYYENIKYCYEKGIKVYDHFGTIGDLRKENPRYGLHIFKKKFGGDYIEFMGEFDLITNKLMYFIFTKLVPLYRNIIKKLSKLKKKKN